MNATPSSPETALGARLVVSDLEVRYGRVTALRPLSLELPPGSVLAVLGPNGAGKTSLANALSGLVESSASSLAIDGEEFAPFSAERRARLGIGHLPDSRAIFPSLSVAENLRMFFHRQERPHRRASVAAAYELFPALARRKGVAARKLSGGEQQMLSFARLIVAPPRLLIVDELSHGLAPGIVSQLFEGLGQLKGSCSMIVIEQFVSRAVALADSVLVLSHGDVQHQGPASSFTDEMASALYSLHVEREDVEPGRAGS